MPSHEHALITNPSENLMTELRQRGVDIANAYLGEFGYTTEDQTDLVCDAVNDLMSAIQEWNPIVWHQLEPDAQRELMLMAADSDTFMEKARLPAGYGYEDRINRFLGLCEQRDSCTREQPTESQVPRQF